MKHDLSYAIGVLWWQRGSIKQKIVRVKKNPQKTELLVTLEERKKVLEKAARILTKHMKEEKDEMPISTS